MKENSRTLPAMLRMMLALVLCLALLPVPNVFAAGGMTMQDLFDAAAKSLADGKPPEQVKEGLVSAADSLNALDFLNCALENLAAADSDETQKMQKLLKDRTIRLDYWNAYESSSLRFKNWEVPEADDSVKALFSDVGGHADLEPAYWTEADIKKFFGKPLKQFKPAESRPGHVCVVLTDRSESAPNTGWKGEPENIDSILEDILTDLRNLMEDDAPALTGNPQLASEFWIIDIQYPYRGAYGSDAKVKGYNLSVTVTAQGAKDHKKIAEMAHKEILPDRISKWSNWIAKADMPNIYSSDKYRGECEKFAKTLKPLIRQERSAAMAEGKITSLTAEKVLNAVLVHQTEKIKDGWQKAIWTSGARDIRLEDGSVTFTLRSYDPKVKELGAYADAEDRAEWLKKALANAGEYNLEITAELEDGTLSKKGLAAVKTAVQKAAGTAKAAFGGKDMTAALKDRLFPSPVEGKLQDASQLMKPTESFVSWFNDNSPMPGWPPAEVGAAAFALLKTTAFKTQDGPHAIAVNCTGGSLKDVIGSGVARVRDDQAYRPASKRAGTDNLADSLKEALLEDTVEAAKKANKKMSFTLDIDELASGSLPAEYRQMFSDFNWDKQVENLSYELSQLPEEAAKQFPKNGLISGGKKGTTVTFRAGDQVYPTYLIMRDTKNDKIVMTAMIHPKKNVTAHVPKGKYIIAWCSGPYWYGTEELFGDLGGYSKSDPYEVLGTNYRHTITLISTSKEGVPVFGADKDDLR